MSDTDQSCTPSTIATEVDYVPTVYPYATGASTPSPFVGVTNTVTTQAYTTETLDGAGVFDSLMRTLKAHLKEEYSQSRIRGTEYATVYLGALNATMDKSLQFLLTRDKVKLEADVLELQAAQMQLDGQRAALEIDLLKQQRNKAFLDGELVKAQAAKVYQDICLAQLQEKKMQEEIDLLQEQFKNQEEETKNTKQQRFVINATKCKLDAEFSVLVQQKLKVVQETALLAQKTSTEAAQITNSAAVGSVIGAQTALYAAQAEGFQRDAEQKMTKMMLDTWNTRRATSSTLTSANPTNLLDDSNIGKVLEKAIAAANLGSPTSVAPS